MQTPQLPPQPSEPQTLGPAGQKGVHWHCPVALQAFSTLVELSQAPQVPPQPSSPQFLTAQLGTQVQTWLRQTNEPKSHSTVESQRRPQPSSPQSPGWQL